MTIRRALAWLHIDSMGGTVTGSASEHNPDRPSWKCRACGRDWPCEDRIGQLLDEYANAPTSLALYMHAQFIDAGCDMPDAPFGVLWDRFLGWARPAPHHSGSYGHR